MSKDSSSSSGPEASILTESLEDLEKQKRNRLLQKSLKELMDTEQIYANDLKNFLDLLRKIKEDKKSKGKPFSKKLDQIIDVLKKILESSQSVLEAIKGLGLEKLEKDKPLPMEAIVGIFNVAFNNS